MFVELNNYHHGIVHYHVFNRRFLFLPLAIGKFNALYPNIKCGYLKKAPIIVWNPYLLCKEADFGMRMNSITNPAIDFTPLVNEPFVLACRRDHPLAARQLVEWQELVNHTLIMSCARSSGNLLIEQQLADKPQAGVVVLRGSPFIPSLGLVEAGCRYFHVRDWQCRRHRILRSLASPDRTGDQAHSGHYSPERRHAFAAGGTFSPLLLKCLGRQKTTLDTFCQKPQP
ncbi:hypothetical protein KCP75_02965 [Salmonella enterica subsp. enterica]|nr:hypothetical protein KCP75_02965 [Salmonella enterica subsp. enterica]